MSTYRSLGLMSGTSLDGLDICYAEYTFENNKWHYQIIDATTLPYSDAWEKRLHNSFHLPAIDFQQLHNDYGWYLADACQEFIQQHHITHLDVIASHGHTVFHQPELGFTTQIGNGQCIKLKTGYPTVYDFRTQDVLLGGQGAPLIPIGDALLFSEFDACLNIGGFANISLSKEGKRIAYDICPTNIVLNRLAKKLGKDFDANGEIAASTTINFELAERLNQLEFYMKNPPKSLGVEWVNQFVTPILDHYSPETAIASFTYHSAFQIAKECQKHHIKQLLVTGGGAYNKSLTESIAFLGKVALSKTDAQLIEYKEALVFGLLGVLRLLQQTNVLSSATGSSHDHCSGILV